MGIAELDGGCSEDLFGAQRPSPHSPWLLFWQTKGPEVEELDAKSRDLLIQQAAQCLSKLVQIAPRAKRNFILDQVPPETPRSPPNLHHRCPGGSYPPSILGLNVVNASFLSFSPLFLSFSPLPQCNVYNSGQRRKLLAFKGFARKVIVIVPNEEDWKKRLELRKEAEGEDVPESVMLEMKGGMAGNCEKRAGEGFAEPSPRVFLGRRRQLHQGVFLFDFRYS